MSAPTETTIQNEFIKMALAGTVNEDDQSPKMVRLMPDRAIAVWSQTVGTDGTRQRVVKVEPTGELDFVMHGKDAAGNIDPFRTNANQQPQIEVVEDHVWVAPFQLTTTAITTVHTATASTLSRVTIVACNTSVAEVATSIWRVPSGGSATDATELMTAFPMPINLPPIEIATFTLEASGLVQMQAASANTITAHLSVREIPL